MFDKYDNNIPEPRPEYRPKPIPDRLIGTTNVRLLKNIGKREIGVSAKEGSAFELYFTFDGYVEEGTLSELLSEASFGFELLDKKHHVVLSAPVTVYPEDCMASVTIVSEYNGIVSYGNYYMRLYMLLDGIFYTLFAENDGVLSID
jgi:hypothetical protein